MSGEDSMKIVFAAPPLGDSSDNRQAPRIPREKRYWSIHFVSYVLMFFILFSDFLGNLACRLELMCLLPGFCTCRR